MFYVSDVLLATLVTINAIITFTFSSIAIT